MINRISRRPSLLAAVAFVAMAMSAYAQAAEASNLQGEWASNYGPARGGLILTNITNDGGRLKGTIQFRNSGCTAEKPFEGRYEDGGRTLVVNTHLGAPCGKVGLKMGWNGSAWKGKYIAEYPDGGDVTLSSK